MGIAELFLIGVGLSMDAFAVAVCKGLAMGNRIDKGQALVTALFFGGFQALMPLAGWALGRQCEGYITQLDHWIAFVLLGVIGGKMIWEALREGEEAAEKGAGRLDLKELTLLALATSIDALAVGVTFAFLKADIALSVSLIGLTTFCLSLGGVWVGHVFGARFKRKAEVAGGAILVLIGLKILLEHLGVWG